MAQLVSKVYAKRTAFGNPQDVHFPKTELVGAIVRVIGCEIICATIAGDSECSVPALLHMLLHTSFHISISLGTNNIQKTLNVRGTVSRYAFFVGDAVVQFKFTSKEADIYHISCIAQN